MPSRRPPLSRREILTGGAQLTAGLALVPLSAAFAAPLPSPALLLKLAPQAPAPLSADFLGLGYEMSSVAKPGLLSAGNERYTRLVKQLGANGVLRVGGIVADYTRFDPQGTPASEPKNTVITRAQIEQFVGFLRAVGWTAIWSLNFAQGTLDEAVTEAKAVAEVLGDRLQAFELGNEVENYGRGSKPFRPPPYDFDAYRAEYTRWHAAISATLPHVRFAAPDTAASINWVERMSADARGEVQLLTTHYYRNGQTKATSDQLQQPDADLLANLERLRVASRASGIPWRMCETNSFYGGGRPGISNTLLGALWTLDFLLLLAVHGCSGVNMETGVNQLGFISSYSPIQDDEHGSNTAGIPYYGMLAFAEAARGCTEVYQLALPVQTAGLTAYAMGSAARVRSVVVINRGSDAAAVSISGLGLGRASALRLSGPSLSSTSGVTFGGSAVSVDGFWRAAAPESISSHRISVPGESAVVLRRP